MNISYDKLMYDPEHGNLRTLSRGGRLIIPMPQEINNLPNVKLGNVVSETETVMTQKFYIQHNEEDYEGVRVVLSTDLDTIMYDALKNETGEYQYDFPIKEKNKTIKYYIYSYKGELKGNYTEKHVYVKDNSPEKFINTLTFRFGSAETDPSTSGLNGTWTKLDSEYNDWKFTANELMPVSHDDEYAFLAELSDENTIVTRKADNVIEIKCNKNSYYYENLDELAKELIIYGFIASTSTGVITIDEENNKILTITLGDKYETVNLYLLNNIDENIEILDGKIDNNVKFVNLMEEVYLTNLTKVIKLDTSNVTAMASMFNGCSSLTTVPLFDTSNVTTMYSMFYECTSLDTVPEFDTSKVTDMKQMFERCSSLTTVPEFDTSKVTDMKQMFERCSSLTTVPLFDTSSVTNMCYMFTECTSLTSVPKFNTSNVNDMMGMFAYCSSLNAVPLFDTSSVIYMASMFDFCSKLSTVPLFDTNSVTDMSRMFNECTSLNTVPKFNTSNVTYMTGMFSTCSSLKSVPLFDTNRVIVMSEMLAGCSSLTEVPLFDTSNVIATAHMFAGCRLLTSVPKFNTSNVTTMVGMFSTCSSLKSVPLFDTSSVTDMSFMFRNCTSLTTVPLFDISSVTDMTYTCYKCEAVESGALALYNTAITTGKVTKHTDCFKNCGSNTETGLAELNQIPTSWGGNLK